eukprot:3971878-Amphidinium_carterae.1
MSCSSVLRALRGNSLVGQGSLASYTSTTLEYPESSRRTGPEAPTDPKISPPPPPKIGTELNTYKKQNEQLKITDEQNQFATLANFVFII